MYNPIESNGSGDVMGNQSIRRQVEHCIGQLRRGSLTEDDLQVILDEADMEAILDEVNEPVEGLRAPAFRQDLLYLQTRSTAIDYPVLGMKILEDGKLSDGPRDPEEWPYKTVLEAVRDGWRIIKFPEMAVLLDESRSYGLACEFILERWRQPSK